MVAPFSACSPGCGFCLVTSPSGASGENTRFVDPAEAGVGEGLGRLVERLPHDRWNLDLFRSEPRRGV